MKTTISKLSFLALAAMPLLGGCTQPSPNASVPVTQQSVTDPAPPPTPPVIAESAAKAEPAPGTPPQLPPLILQSAPALAEFSKLAQAGVDESVMLSYITNSTQLFNATADQIVYLNDLGVPGSVITAMIQHDQSLKQFWAGNSSPSAPVAQTPASAPAPTETVAAAPTYVNPPQPETVPVAATQPTTIVNNNYFHDSLSPYGTWVEIEGYGRCWQPTVVVVNSDWRPYRDGGRWVYTDAGWYWLSDYSWGSTAFHYGRWFTHPRWGWCWWPDTVWASSWVSWRYSGDYCGWAPIPPHYGYHSGVGFTYYGRSVSASFNFGLGWTSFNYVPWRNVCEPRPRRYCAPTGQIRQIHGSTTVINNYGSGPNNTVVNNGVTPARVRDLSKHEIKPIRLREDQREIRNGRREQISPDGGTLTVNRPPLEDHRGNGRRDRETGPRPVGAPVANLAPTPSVPSATSSPRARDNDSPSRSRNEIERTGQDSRGGRNITTTPVTTPSTPVASTPSVQPRTIEKPRGREPIEGTPNDDRGSRYRRDGNPGDKPPAPIPVTKPPSPTPTPPATVSAPSVEPKLSRPAPLIIDNRKNGRDDANRNNAPARVDNPTAPAPVATGAPTGTPLSGQLQSTEPLTVRQRVEERRNSTVQYPTPPTSATPMNIPNSRIVAPRSQPQPQTSHSSPAASATRVWTQPQPQQPARVEPQRQIVPGIEDRRQDRSVNRDLPQQQIRTAPASAAPPPAAPRFTPPAQVSAPVGAPPRQQTLESRPSPTPPPIRTESRSESRLESKKTGSSNGDSNNGRRQR